MERLFVVGKGGVGKTTLATALALLESKSRKVLLYSLDPLPNVGMLLNENLGFKPKLVRDNLYAGEVDYEEAKEWWKRTLGKEVYEVINEIIDVGEEIIDYIASAPGIVEQFILLYVIEEGERLGVDLTIFDTPPLGPTLNMLKAERDFYLHLSQSKKFYLKLAKLLPVAKAFKTIERWRGLAEKVLNSVANSHYVLVSTPQRISLRVAELGSKELEKFGVKFKEAYINMGEGPCIRPPTYSLPRLDREPIGDELLTLLKSRRRIC